MRLSIRSVHGGALAAALVLASGFLIEPQRAWPNFLLAFFMLISFSLSALVWWCIHDASGSSWAERMRPVLGGMGAVLPAVALLGLLLLAGISYLYPWQVQGGTDPVLAAKRAWLNRPFFTLRTVVYLASWAGLGTAVLRNTVAARRPALAAAFLVVFGLTFHFASADWIMSLEPHWYSTIYGVYTFAGLLESGLATATLLLLALDHFDPAAGLAPVELRHDLGKMLFAFSNFWAYIWFSQYLLIWYANLPEESAYYLRRRGEWGQWQWANLALNWAIPFLVLAGQEAKKRKRVLAGICAVLCLGHWLDLYLLVMPGSGRGPAIGFWEVLFPLGGALIFLSLFSNRYRRWLPA